MTHRLLLIAAFSVVTFARAMAVSEGPLAFTATLQIQSSGTPSGSNLSVPAPIKYALTSKTIMPFLAQGLHDSGLYSGPIPFPAAEGWVLMAQQTGGDIGTAQTYYVTNKAKTMRIFVNTLLKSQQNSSNLISGTLGPGITPVPKLTFLTTDALSFTNIANNFTTSSFHFTTSGIYSQVWSIGTVNRISGMRKETIAMKTTGASGTGTYFNSPAVVSAAYSSTGTAQVP